MQKTNFLKFKITIDTLGLNFCRLQKSLGIDPIWD